MVVTRWEGNRVVRFTPDGKAIDLEVHIPEAYNVTACCFGGEELKHLTISLGLPYIDAFRRPEYGQVIHNDCFVFRKPILLQREEYNKSREISDVRRRFHDGFG